MTSSLKVTFSDTPKAIDKKSGLSGAVIVAVEEGKKLGEAAQRIDAEMGGAITRALKVSRFTGKSAESLTIVAPQDAGYSRIYLYGVGRGLELLQWQDTGGRLVKALNADGEKEAILCIDLGTLDPAEAGASAAFGALLANYRFDKYRTQEKAADKPTLKKLTVQSDEPAKARKIFKDQEAVAEGVFFTRDLVSEPPNVLYPESFAKQVEALRDLGVEVEVMGEKKLEKLGMGALLAVGRGSRRESQVVVMRWNGAGKSTRPLAFVGKGVTFDTGGISLKPAAGMEEMKWDMGGAGTVAGLMKALAGRKAKANVIGAIGLVENMPDGDAQRPGDIVTSMSGQTIEVINTDAEGRLVLCDVLHHVQKEYKPQLIVDLATLTGAIIIGLGHEHAGLFSNDDELAERLHAAGRDSSEKVWRLPMGEDYDKQLKSDVADMKNVGGRPAGSITAAQFLARFIDNTKWAHLDIAGMAWSSKDKPTVPKGATGFGVRLLDRFVADHYG
ncbi:leucyl aminopeptidase [Marivibrio halodurans]|uniref:Probable cytosol aminopeptidase n=1 Tax=Marivibrio halodurans TaxID=2039722 RepID=A0A8J7SIJ0_9PROT|nr:leucyl aminopeptidase [Marivibrio halodurans]MBP5857093.1 leucyl aminopeptidase [Marivibrio halodurans]